MAAIKREWFNGDLDDGRKVSGLIQQAQTFTVGNTGLNENFDITKVVCNGFIHDSPSMLFVAIKAVDGEGKPTGLDLSTGSIDPSGWGVGGAGIAYHGIEMTDYTLRVLTQYALIWRSPDSNGGGPYWGLEETSPTYAGGNRVSSADGGDSWTHDTERDFHFEIWGEAAAAVAAGGVKSRSGFRPIEGADRLRGLGSSSLY